MTTSNQHPKWFNENYMENVIQTYRNDKTLKIVHLEMEPFSAKGENYCGIMTRIHLKYSSTNNPKDIKNVVFISKTSIDANELSVKALKDYDIYNREMNIYDKVLPKLTSFLKDINDNDEIFPQKIFVDYKNPTIILEDLAVRSFVMADRKDCLDLKHAKLIMRKLAKMHATSAVLNERYNGILETFNLGLFNRGSCSFSTFFESTFQLCGEEVMKWNGCKKYGEKILQLVPHFVERSKQAFDALPNQFNVFAHGDFWTNNVMFKYNSAKEPIDAHIVDFQYCCWGSPAIDLHYFLNTSVQNDIKMGMQDELIQCYYEVLSKTLKDLQFKGKIPSLHELWIEIQKKSFYAITSACCAQAVMLNESDDGADFNTLMETTEVAMNCKRNFFKNDNIKRSLEIMLPIYERRGLLDV